ncbi:MAG: hypothetical protein ACR2N3_12055 [Pyrinomonadaceae bacterium]
MKKILLVGLVICFTSIFSFAQTKSFSAIDEFLTNNGGSFDNRDEIVTLFNKERVRLGGDFETELWKYLGKDVRKYYWTSAFLEDKDYSQDKKPMPKLAYEVKLRGTEIPVDKDDVEGLGMKVTLLRDAAIKSSLDGNRELAIKYKKRATEIMEKNNLAAMGVIGATTEFDQCIYDNLEKDTSMCKKDAP